jgi:hypothetical protein
MKRNSSQKNERRRHAKAKLLDELEQRAHVKKGNLVRTIAHDHGSISTDSKHRSNSPNTIPAGF